jgi:hypothetical protein
MDMTENFKDRESFIQWFLIAAMAGMDMTETVVAKPSNITMQINGIEMNPLRAIQRMEEEFKRQIEDAANEKVEDLKNEILDPFEEQVQDMTAALKNLVSKKLKG